jgi:hypothetical protein
VSTEDTFAKTWPDIRKLRAQDDQSAEMVRLMTEFARAGMKLETRMEAIELRHAGEDGERKARNQMGAFLQWAIGIAIAVGAFFAGRHLK